MILWIISKSLLPASLRAPVTLFHYYPLSNAPDFDVYGKRLYASAELCMHKLNKYLWQVQNLFIVQKLWKNTNKMHFMLL